MQYYIPEWDDRIDVDYDFLSDKHSERHQTNPRTDSYMWQVFGEAQTPFDGILISLMAIDGNNGKAKEIRSGGGIRQYLGLPDRVKVLADCGAWGYLKKPKPPFDPIEVLAQYEELGVQEAVTVDHLVLAGKDPRMRMDITRSNGIKGFDAWKSGYRSHFDLLVSVQGLEVSDYVQMFDFYSAHGITKFAFGGLAKRKTSFIADLVSRIINRNATISKTPERVHFFGLGRPELFPRFRDLEANGIEVSFDTASWLRRAWLNGHYYMVEHGKFTTYTSVRVEIVDSDRSSFRGKRKLSSKANLEILQRHESECLKGIRDLDVGKATPSNVSKSLAAFHSAITQERVRKYREDEADVDEVAKEYKRLLDTEKHLQQLYPKTLEDRPWEKCECNVCRRLGIDVIMLRGNNRNRARGFHNVYTMYHKVVQDQALWEQFERHKKWDVVNEQDLVRLSGRVLVITGCTKTKLGYDSNTRAKASEMYKGRLFKIVRNYTLLKHFPLMIISAKYGLIRTDQVIQGYEKVISSREDVLRMKPLVTATLRPLLPSFDKVVVIAGERYRQTLQDVWDDRFSYVKSGGYAKLAQLVGHAMQELQPKLVSYL